MAKLGLARSGRGRAAGVVVLVVALLGVGLVASSAVAGAAETGHIGNRVWVDRDGDGRQEPGEPGLSGVGLLFSTVSGRPLLKGSSTVGGWWGVSLPVGECVTLSVTPPAGFGFTVAGGDSKVDASGGSGPICPTSAAQTGWDVGLVPTSGAVPVEVKVGNRVWSDLDGDGRQEPGEPGVAGAGITITDPDGNALLRGVTSAEGWWGLRLVVGSCYRLVVSAPVGLVPTVSGGESVVGADGRSGVLCPTVDDDGWDVGFTVVRPDRAPRVSVSLSIWYDNDNNGVRGPGDTGARGYRVGWSSSVAAGAATGTTGPDGTTSGSWDLLGFDLGAACNFVMTSGVPGNVPNSGFTYDAQVAAFSYSPRDPVPNPQAFRLSGSRFTVCIEGAPPTGWPTIVIPRGQDLDLRFDVGLRGPDPWL